MTESDEIQQIFKKFKDMPEDLLTKIGKMCHLFSYHWHFIKLAKPDLLVSTARSLPSISHSRGSLPCIAGK